MKSVENDIFKKGSTTYYWSSKFFPKDVRDDVFKLYSFVRVVDDYVDQIPQDEKSFQYVLHGWKEIKKDITKTRPLHPNSSIADRVLNNIGYIVHRYECDPAWVDAFLASMQMDVKGRDYNSIDDTLDYIYGSAEVIGLFMAKILGLSDQATSAAQMQGRAMQMINFLRDIDEDLTFGRVYFPVQDMKKFGLSSLAYDDVKKNAEGFKNFMHYELDRYRQWQAEAAAGFHYIPKKLRIPIRTAVDMYNWTAKEINKDPFVVFDKKIKPKKHRIIKTVMKRSISG